MTSAMLLKLWWIPVLVFLAVGYKFVLRFFAGVVIVPQDGVGVVEKKFVLFGKNRTLPDGKIIALAGEAGIQADTLAPGIHYGLWPWQYNVHLVDFITIKEGKIGVVEARDGSPLSAGRVLAKKVECDAFQNARQFLENGGERGPQIIIIPPGTYRVNTALFTVVEENVTEIEDNMVGVVTTREGKSLETGDIAGREIPAHNMFQDAQAFLDGGGYKGLQEQVLTAGRYFLNPRFVTVEIKDMTIVPIANVGVVISYVGDKGIDVTGDAFKHGNLVSRGQKGVWAQPLDPGKYPINPYTHKVELVPTANVVLNWATGKTEAHNLDKNLSTITVRSSDGFTFNLDVSQIIHIPSVDAPKVIARFGSIANLVTQVLEPTIGNYFRNAAQGSDVIDFLRGRQDRQNAAKASISAALTDYNVGAVDTLIGDITPPADLMKTLTDRKIAEQEKVTYSTQKEAQEVRKELAQAQAQADTQSTVVKAERDVEIAEFNAKSLVKKAEGDALSKTINADADAKVAIAKAGGDAQSKTINAKADAEATRVNGEALAGKTLAIGNAEAQVIQKKTEAVGKDNYALIQVGTALAENKIKLVPDIIAGGADGEGGSFVNVLLAQLVSRNLPAGSLAGSGTLQSLAGKVDQAPVVNVKKV